MTQEHAGLVRASAVDDGYEFEISGGHPALDFTNTVGRRVAPVPNEERLVDYGRFVSWGVQAGLITAEDGERLRAAARKHPRAAVTAVKRAIELREAIFVLFASIARGEQPPPEALATLNAALPEALGALHVARQGKCFAWEYAHGDDDLSVMLAPVVRGAAELLTSDDLGRIRECGSDTCAWLFLDRSKNGTRRWCDMRVCGNRAKARRHYRREKAAVKAKRGK